MLQICEVLLLFTVLIFRGEFGIEGKGGLAGGFVEQNQCFPGVTIPGLTTLHIITSSIMGRKSNTAKGRTLSALSNRFANVTKFEERATMHQSKYFTELNDIRACFKVNQILMYPFRI